MKKYYIKLLIIAVLLVLTSFLLLWCGTGYFLMAMPLAVLYFTVVTGLEHWAIVKSVTKDARVFVKNFLGLTVGCMFLHLVVLCIYMFTHLQTAKVFTIAFCILYVIYLVFETIELLLFVKGLKNDKQ